MPVYVYEAKDAARSCARCRDGFETTQSVNDPRLETCPYCGADVFRVIQPAGLGRSRTDLHYRARRAGFHTLKRVSKGEYEKMY